MFKIILKKVGLFSQLFIRWYNGSIRMLFHNLENLIDNYVGIYVKRSKTAAQFGNIENFNNWLGEMIFYIFITSVNSFFSFADLFIFNHKV